MRKEDTVMYINPYLAGILTTILAEVVIIIIAVIIYGIKNNGGDK